MGDNRCAFCGDSANYRLLCEQHAREDAEITAMNDNRARVEFSDDGQHIRKWSRLPFDGGECLYSHPAPRAEAPSQGVEKIAYAIIEGSGGKRAAEHAREFVTANWEDAMRSAYAVMALSTGQQKGPSQ